MWRATASVPLTGPISSAVTLCSLVDAFLFIPLVCIALRVYTTQHSLHAAGSSFSNYNTRHGGCRLYTYKALGGWRCFETPLADLIVALCCRDMKFRPRYINIIVGIYNLEHDGRLKSLRYMWAASSGSGYSPHRALPSLTLYNNQRCIYLCRSFKDS